MTTDSWLSRFLRGLASAWRPKEDSDFGRRYGWYVERAGQRIGELDYVRWDSNMQFWHEYRVTWFKPYDAPADINAWHSEGLVLRNRRYTDVVIGNFLVSPERESGIIGVRGASVPKEILRRRPMN